MESKEFMEFKEFMESKTFVWLSSPFYFCKCL